MDFPHHSLYTHYNMAKQIPFTKRQVEDLAQLFPTPFYIYDETGIRSSARALIDAFDWNEGFKQFFAIKALPNPAIVQLLKEEGCGADCSSLPELLISEKVGLKNDDIIFTSNNTPAEEFVYANKLGAIINIDAEPMLPFLEKNAGLPVLFSCRYNPNSDDLGNGFIGESRDSKFGMTKEQLLRTYPDAKTRGVLRFGIHTMTASNELDPQHFINAAKIMFELVLELRDHNIPIEFANVGGGIGIPYRPEQREIDLQKVSEGIRELFEHYRVAPLRLQMECGRYITGPHGYLVSRVRHIKETYRTYAGLDASMSDLMRPGMYGAYHHISVLGKESAATTRTYDVTGSLCENNDKFAIDRTLPELTPGDLVVIHDAGAHAHTMGFNYNGKLRGAEFLLSEDSFQMIRRAQTIEDHFSTLLV